MLLEQGHDAPAHLSTRTHRDGPWRVLRRRATHNRLFMSRARLRATLRSNISYFQTMRQKVLALIESPRKAKKEAKLAAA
jgi:hypothetical protein